MVVVAKQSAQTSRDFITALVLHATPSHITIPITIL